MFTSMSIAIPLQRNPWPTFSASVAMAEHNILISHNIHLLTRAEGEYPTVVRLSFSLLNSEQSSVSVQRFS